ncbi:hypothetical protein [Serratia bockelmannii]|uniref:hypothetical protein n=1 Tax=Serratia bockelmannii TaxID=2703793 RepID=UPI003FA76745
MANYSGSGFVSDRYWSSEQGSVGYHYDVSLSNGDIDRNYDSFSRHVVCRQDL